MSYMLGIFLTHAKSRYKNQYKYDYSDKLVYIDDSKYLINVIYCYLLVFLLVNNHILIVPITRNVRTSCEPVLTSLYPSV